jgi:hypothetical protein
MSAGSVLWKWLVLLAIAGLVCSVGLLALVRHEEHVGIGSEIGWDDFGFTVLDHSVEERIGDVEPRGVFHRVRLLIYNHALRVGYRLDNHRAVLMDEDGGEYEVDLAAERVLDPKWPHREELPHGQRFYSDLVFDVPKDKKDLRMRIAWGGGLVDFLDKTVFGPRDISLK